MKSPGVHAASNQRRPSALRRVISAGRPNTGLIVLAIAIAIVEVAATLSFPVITRDIIDDMGVRAQGPEAALTSSRLGFLIAILVAGAICGAVSAYLLSRTGLRITRNVQARLFDGVMARPVAFFDREESGALVSRIVNDTKVISQLLTTSSAGLVTGLLLMSGSIVVLTLLDGALTGMIFAIVIGTFLLMAPMIMRLASINKSINAHGAKVGGSLARTFSGIRLVKAFTAEDAERRRLDVDLVEVERHSRRMAVVQSMLSPANGLALTAALILLFTYGSARVAAGTLSAGTLTAFILYIFNIVGPLIQLSTFVSRLRMAQGAAEPLAELLDQAIPASLPTSGRAWPGAATGDIVFDNVEFGYDEATLLEIDRLVIPAGKRTAIIGASGCGKSTLLALIERFYEPRRGSIRCGGREIAGIDLADWRQAIGYVPQTAPLMTGSVRDNIIYGAPDIDEARIEAAAAAANCLEFISRMPAGLDSDVGENGVLLSGGQRQRIALARLFYRDPAILLLDEATASLDEDNGHLAMESIQRLMDGRTTIIVTHQISTLRNIDRMFSIAGGRLVEVSIGTPRATPVPVETALAI